MSEDELRQLDAAADRCGDLYQLIGRLGHEHDVDVEKLLDEALSIIQDIERASGRTKRELDRCH